MIIKLSFTDENRLDIIADQTALGYRLTEEQRHVDGNYLVFTDELPVDWQADWDAALPGEKIKVLARRLGIQPG